MHSDRALWAGRLSVLGFILAVVGGAGAALMIFLPTFLYSIYESQTIPINQSVLDEISWILVCLSVVAIPLGIVALRLRTPNRATAGAAIALGAGTAFVTVLIGAAPFI